MEQFTDVRIEDEQQNYNPPQPKVGTNKIGLNKNYLPTTVLYLLISVRICLAGPKIKNFTF